MNALNAQFGEKYANLKLFDVVYDRGLNVCNITFLYPYNEEELDKESRETLTAFIREFLSLEAKVRLKLKKSFLDGALINKEIKNFFESEHKGIAQYILEENIVISSDGFNQTLDISLNQDVLSLLDTRLLTNKLHDYLAKRFIANFKINFLESEDTLPTEIDYEDVFVPQTTGTKRYDVRVIKKIIGNDIPPKPEYIEFITKPKNSVILAGTISNYVKKTFTRKSGKRKGEEGCLISFILEDGKKIECIYFCPKSNLKKMEALADGMMVLGLGDVIKGLGGGLNYKIRKLSYASPAPKVQIDTQVQSTYKHNQVVFPEPIPMPAQANLFEDKPKYNDFILSNTIVVFDLETTGLNPENCEITEIGAVKIVNGQIKERFASFVKPKEEIPEEVTRLTGITNEMVAHAPRVEDVIADFYDYTRGCILSGHNVIGFDMNFVKKAGAKCGLKFDNTVIDTLIIARQSSLRVPNYKLGTLVNALGLTLTDAHRAYNDAYATAQVLLELSKVK